MIVRIDTPVEVGYFTHGGILPFVLENLMAEATRDKTNEQAERLSN